MPYPNPSETLFKTIQRIEGAYAPSTIRAYRENFTKFIGYCEANGVCALPAISQTVASYIAKLSDGHLKSSSIRLAIASISAIHRLNRMVDPTKDPDVSIETRRMHRKLGRSAKQAQAITSDILEKMLGAIDETTKGVRDRALLLLAYDSLCRRSELVSLQFEDVSNPTSPETLAITLRRSKTDPEGMGKRLFLSERTKLALADWIKASGMTSGPLFTKLNHHKDEHQGLSPAQINKIYKQLASKANLNCGNTSGISGHSPRVGCAQDLLKSGASMPMIMTRGRWSKTDTVMRYVENAL